MISTNTIKPKENKRFDEFLKEEMIEGKPTGNIVSHIPSRVIATSQESFKGRKVPSWPSPESFPGVRKVVAKKTDITFLQNQDLRGIEKQRLEAEAKAAKAAMRLDVLRAKKQAKPKKRAGRKK